MNRSIAFWNKFARTYDRNVKGKYKKTYEDTVEIAKKYLKEDDEVLDFACGTGITTLELSKCVRRVKAIDLSEKMLALAREKAIKEGVQNIEFSARDLFDARLEENSFDVIMAFNILYLLEDTDQIVQRIAYLLKPGGMFLSATDCLGERKTISITIQSMLSKLGMLPNMRLFTKSEMGEIVQAGGFSILETVCLYDSPPNFFIAGRKTRD